MMLMSLFSVFDPCSYFELSLNWLILFFVLMFFPIKYFKIMGGYYGFNEFFNKLVEKMFKEISFPNYMMMVYVSLVAFFYIMISNLMGLFPYIFTSTAHPMITMGMGFVFWVSFVFMGWLKNFKESAAHLVPKGSPLLLSPLMVIIEFISHLIRPFTLSIRLAANMMAGHLIVGLLSSISLMNLVGFFSSFLMQSILLVLEFGVSVVQGFVFSILLLLYALEYY